MIKVTETLALDEKDIEERFIRASGPGGQNVNKVASAVQLRFKGAGALPPAVQQKLARLAGRRLTDEGVLVITAQRFRSQERNRADAMERLIVLLQRAAEPTTPRRPTRPTLSSRRDRLDAKKRRAALKRRRTLRTDEE